ncbi:MAG: response regulator [Acidobacteria bacterium]|nr:response regulator [Acidobacteriota bacterium]MYJ05737.1 response regulator [Acidobacteriota bacterium]
MCEYAIICGDETREEPPRVSGCLARHVRQGGGNVQESPDQLRRRIKTLEDRISNLCAAVLRVSASLDLETVLREIVDNARALTGARYGVIATVDEAGQPQDFVTVGLAPGQHEKMAAWPDGPRLFEHFRNLRKSLRVADLPAYVRELGFSWELMVSGAMQCTPMRHRDVYVGNFFLGGKEGGQQFTSADEEVLVLFASQAATAIANARTHRDERRARADLEALVETSPVGVVVFDGKSRSPVSLNREARRIVERLRVPGRALEDLLDVTTCRFGDGREVALAEFPNAEQLTSAETVRAEEITLSVPHGPSVTTLVNATPIRSADGTVESMVVTMQDLAPLEELERLRVGFLGMVSHELRTPLSSIKGSTVALLGSSRAPDPAETLQFLRVIDEQADQMLGLIADLLDQGRIETGTLSVSVEPARVASLVERARNTLLSSGGGHDLKIDLAEDLPRVMADPGRIVQVLNNLLSNASRQSPESSPIRVGAARDGLHVAISVSDQGRGVPPDRLPHLFRKYAGAAAGEGEHRFAGYGLGLSICKGLVEAHGGRIWAESDGAGRGTRFTFTLPVAEDIAGATGSARSRPRGLRKGEEQTCILAVDDDPQTLRYVRDALTEADYAPVVTGDPSAVPGLIRKHKPRLVLLDLMLPGTDGIELMEEMRELEDLPVIFISAYGRDETIVRALNAGAADYIVKPFSPSELTARVRAALRRRAEPEAFLLGELAIHYDERRVTVAGRPVTLTVTEYEVLRVLSTDAGRTVTYDSLLHRAWSRRDRGSGDPKLVRAIVKTLRRKLGDDAANPAYVCNERGVGYRMPRPEKR